MESKEELEIVQGYAIARKGQHKVIFAADIATPGAIDLEMPCHTRATMHVLGLALFDQATGQSALIAEIKSSTGIVDRNQIVYVDAFTEISGDIRFTYTQSGLEQDVIIHEQLPFLPEDLGMSSQTTVLQVLTEFVTLPAVTRRAERIMQADGQEVEGEELDFGSMRISRGDAFRFDAGRRDDRSVRVQKLLRKLDGRDILIEQVPMRDVAEELRRLPPRTGAAPASGGKAIPRTASIDFKLPAAPKLMAKANAEPMLLARYRPPERSFLLDYQAINSTLSNFTFQSDLTYYVTARTDLYAATVFEGGAVLKFVNTTGADLWVQGSMVWNTAPYRPVVFTSKNDDSIGVTIPGSTGLPSRQQHVGLVTAQSGTVRGARFLYARGALCPLAALTVEDAQFVDCQIAVNPYGQAVTLRNALFIQTDQLVIGSTTGLTVTGEHWTADRFGTLVEMQSGKSLTALNLTNCLFTAGTNWVTGQANPNIQTNAVTWLASSTGVYQTAGAGGYYLADGSPYRDAGVTNLTTSTLDLIRARTTYPPVVLSNTTISVDTTFTPQAARDTDTPDLGYHYAPLDYLLGGTTADANVTFAPGTAVGWFRNTAGWQHAGHGLFLADTRQALFDGQALAPCYWVHQTAVQEGLVGYSPMADGPGGITGRAASAALAPTLTLRFTRCSGLPPYRNHFRDDDGALNVSATDCEFYGGGIGGYISNHSLTNCLFDRASVWLSGANPQYQDYFALRSCTLRGGRLSIDRWSAALPVRILDCAFDWTTNSTSDAYANNPTYTTYNYNAFRTNASRLSPQGANDLVLTNTNGFAWQTGPLGNYYLPSNSPLIDAGSLNNAALAGLYHHTTQTNQAKEAATRLDIGFHYVACDANGNPVDTDNDGLPDYQDEDSDGDDLPDWWELEHFADLSQTADGDYDGDGATNREEFEAGTDPNTFTLMTQYENLQTTNRTVTGGCLIFGGIPVWMAVLVNSTNTADADWLPFATNFSATLPDLDGEHVVGLALRGHSTSLPPVLDETIFTLDRVPPVLLLTNPAVATVTRPYVQLQGLANEPLATLSYDLANAAGTLTNAPVLVVHQHLDTNQFEFTTNYFQAYDVELTNGVNTLTLRVRDRAGNMTTTNLTLTLSYATATNPPVLALLWPTNGAHLSGESFFLRGRINDETARLWAERVVGGFTNEHPGLVERDGTFWVENLPLAAGTNDFTIIARDAAGNLSSTNLTVVKSEVDLAITAAPEGDALYAPFGTVFGTVTAASPAYSVTVNGVAASVDGYGNWTANGVPVLGRGTATFTAMATGAGGAPAAAAAVQQEMPARIVIAKHHAESVRTRKPRGLAEATSASGKDYLEWLEPDGPAGGWQQHLSAAAAHSLTDPPYWYQAIYQWTTTNQSAQYADASGWSATGSAFSDPFGDITCVPERDVRYDAPQGTVITYLHHYHAAKVRHGWTYLANDSGDRGSVGVRVRALTEMKLYTGGKSGIQRRSLFHLTGWADQYGRPPGTGPSTLPWFDTPAVPVRADKLRALDGRFTPRANSPLGDLYLTQPDNTMVDLALRVPGAKHYYATAEVEKLRLEVNAVSFQGQPQATPVIRDDGSDYSGFHWLTNEVAGTEWGHPVLYVSGQAVQTYTGFKSVGGGTFPLVIKGVASGGGTSFKLWGTNTANVGSVLWVDTAADTALTANRVDFYNPMTIQWYYAYTNKPEFLYAGRSTNQVYVTLRAPTNGVTLYHTVAHLSCLNANGETTATGCTAKIWSEFTDRDVRRMDGARLTYYASFLCTNTTTATLLAAGDGQCGAWAKFFLDARKVQGIDDPDDYCLFEPISDDGFVVKNWTFTGTGTSGHPTHPHLNIFDNYSTLFGVTNYNWVFAEVNDANGVQGQGNNNPASMFNNHQVVIGNKFYDPSYGIQHDNLQEVDNTLDGFYIEGTYPVDEPTVNLDLNSDGDRTDLGVVVNVRLFRSNPTGLDIRRNLSYTNY